MNNSSIKTAFLVASWEFNRFFKWKSFLSGIVTSIIMGSVGFFGTTWLLKDNLKTQRIFVVERASVEVTSMTLSGFEFKTDTKVSIDSAIALMENKEVDGVLAIPTLDSAKLWLPGKRSWSDQLAAYISTLRQDKKLADYGVEKATLEDINASVHLETIIQNDIHNSKIKGVIAAVLIGLVLIALFMGFSFQFTAITGEKQQRITEQVISAISPQIWIDGKILGITGIGLMYVLLFSVFGLLGSVVIGSFTSFNYMAIMSSLNIFVIVIFLLFSLLGILMWNSFMAAIAATVDDPYASDKASLMLLPILPVLFAFFTLMNADTWAMKFMGIFPLTSFAVLPARMSLTYVAPWEIILALLLLVATTWAFRRTAGKIFSLAILMHGKEPTFKEMFHWLKR